MLSSDLQQKVGRLFDWFDAHNCAVAFSGGVDSAALAQALVLATKKRPYWKNTAGETYRKIIPTGYFAVSATSTEVERLETPVVAREIGIELKVFESTEFMDVNFVTNSERRCYWCKKNRFSAIQRALKNDFERETSVFLIDGSNADDSKDFRPGSQAALEVGVLSPFAELGFTKSDIRSLASHWGLSVADKPSNPCLATRVAYNMPLEEKTLRQIERAEIVIRELSGERTCRARVDAPGAVRIEVFEQAIEKISASPRRYELVERLRAIGFVSVSLDLEGFYTGKNNRSLVNLADADVACSTIEKDEE